MSDGLGGGRREGKRPNVTGHPGGAVRGRLGTTDPRGRRPPLSRWSPTRADHSEAALSGRFKPPHDDALQAHHGTFPNSRSSPRLERFGRSGTPRLEGTEGSQNVSLIDRQTRGGRIVCGSVLDCFAPGTVLRRRAARFGRRRRRVR